MKRKELYKKMFEAAISEAGISGEVSSDIQDDIDLYNSLQLILHLKQT